MAIRDPLTAPGVPEHDSDRERAIKIARLILHGPSASPREKLLACEFLKVLGLPVQG